MQHRVFIGLGANLKNPLEQLRQAKSAIAQLPQSSILSVSSVYQSKPIGPQNQPDFLNAALCIATEFSPQQLLAALQKIEQQQGRQRIQHWGPRTLDLDILLFDDEVIDQPDLKIPHPEMLNRAFVLVPLAEIAPEKMLSQGMTVFEAQQCLLQKEASLYKIDPVI